MGRVSHPGDMWPQRLSQQSTCTGTPLWASCHLLPWLVGPLQTDVSLSPSTWQGLQLVQLQGGCSLLSRSVFLAQSPLLSCSWILVVSHICLPAAFLLCEQRGPLQRGLVF